jgi:uncharacterized protein (TIGR03437 family)
VAPGAAAPIQTLEAFNIGDIGDGSLSLSVSVPPGVAWLAASVGAAHTCMNSSTGSCIPLEFTFDTAGLAQGTYTAFVTVSDPQAADAPQVVSVTVQVATGGVAQIVASGADYYQEVYGASGPICFRGCSPPFSSKASTEDGGTWLAVSVNAQTTIGLYWTAYVHLAPPATMAPGTYNGSVAIVNSNTATGNEPIPVTMAVPMPQIVPQGPPILFYMGVVDDATFEPGAAVAMGDVTTIFGGQLSESAPRRASGVPLPASLGGASVFVNGLAAPLFYSSFGQILFQMPSGTSSGAATVQVMRDGQMSNTVSVNVAQRAPKIAAVTSLSYDLRDVSHPASAGDTLILWAVGLGPTTPNVPDGAPAPADPPAIVTDAPTARFSGSVYHDVAPSFAGLSPGGVGLYQVAVTVPLDAPPGIVNVALCFPGLCSNSVPVAVQ